MNTESTRKNNKLILLPYQRAWIDDKAQQKIWLASRQIGKSFTLAFEAVLDALDKRSVNLILSASQRQSKEVMQKVYSHLRVLRAISAGKIDSEAETKEEVILPNGSRIISLPASPDTVRGFSGNIFLDEFAFHQDADEIWRAMYPSITRGYKIRVSSTPNGKSNLFYRLMSQNNGFSKHVTTIYDALKDGLPIDIELLRSGIMDPDAWAQEYECQFVDEATAFLTYAMIAACEDAEATLDFLIPQMDRKREFYLGMDIGRKNDRTILWLWEKIGDIFWTRAAKEMRNAPFAAQRDILYGFMDGSFGVNVRRACIDSTGIGAQMAEEAITTFGPSVEAVVFTGKVKEDLAVTMRRTFEDRKARIPADREIREDFHSVKRLITPSGNSRFDADRTELGHADRFWAAALGLHACINNASGPIEFEAVGGGSISKFKTLKHFLGF